MVENNGQPETGPETGAGFRLMHPRTRPPERREEERVCTSCSTPFTAVIEFRTIAGREMTFGDRSACPPCREKQLEEEELEAERGREEEIALIRESLRRRAGVPQKFWDLTFDKWVEEREWKQTRAFKTVRRWVRDLPDPPLGYPSLILHSPKGHGKSALVACAMNYLVDTWPVDPRSPVLPVRYETGPSLGLRVRATYNMREGDVQWRETEAEVYDSLRGVKLLVLDDVGDSEKEPKSAHTKRVYFHLIDLRYRDDLPVLLCTNSIGQELESMIGEYAYDRLLEMAERVVTVAGFTRAQRLQGRS